MAKPESTALVQRDMDAVAKVAQTLQQIPGLDEDPTGRFLDLVMSVTSPEDWARIWEKLESVKDNEGRALRVHDIRLRESDFEGSTYYLLLDATWLDTGERQMVSCSSTMMCLQLAKAYAEGWLPLDLEIQGPRKPSRAGFRPLHFHAVNPEELKAKAEAV